MKHCFIRTESQSQSADGVRRISRGNNSEQVPLPGTIEVVEPVKHPSDGMEDKAGKVGQKQHTLARPRTRLLCAIRIFTFLHAPRSAGAHEPGSAGHSRPLSYYRSHYSSTGLIRLPSAMVGAQLTFGFEPQQEEKQTKDENHALVRESKTKQPRATISPSCTMLLHVERGATTKPIRKKHTQRKSPLESYVNIRRSRVLTCSHASEMYDTLKHMVQSTRRHQKHSMLPTIVHQTKTQHQMNDGAFSSYRTTMPSCG